MDSCGWSLQGSPWLRFGIRKSSFHPWAAGQPLVVNCRFKLNGGKPGARGNVEGDYKSVADFSETFASFFIQRVQSRQHKGAGLTPLHFSGPTSVNPHLGNTLKCLSYIVTRGAEGTSYVQFHGCFITKQIFVYYL